jgi:cyclophilin family peptidyl-prolyl cis-trans isomerase
MQQPSNLAFPGILSATEANKKIRIKTNKGDIVIQTSVEMGPRAASNFVYLAKQEFYNGTIFHRVIPGFMIQGGDPTGTGMGGPGYQFQNDEVKKHANQEDHDPRSNVDSPRLRRRVGRHGQCRTQHQRLPILHHGR